jgi:hypothetical protein
MCDFHPADSFCMLILQFNESCKHEGYAEYPFPAAWGSDVNNYAQMEDCGDVPPDGAGVPEQFWNCGEVKIERKRGSKKRPQFHKSWYREAADRGDVNDEVEASSGPVPNNVVTSNQEADHMTDVNTHTDEAQAIPDGEFVAEISVDEPHVEAVEDEKAEVIEDSPAPTGPCSDPSFSGYEGTEDCSGYIWCQGGVPGAEYPCGEGTLWDDRTQMCNWADEVRCPGAAGAMLEPGETLSPVPPTPHPTQKPNPLLEWDRSNMKRNHDKVRYRITPHLLGCMAQYCISMC